MMGVTLKRDYILVEMEHQSIGLGFGVAKRKNTHPEDSDEIAIREYKAVGYI